MTVLIYVLAVVGAISLVGSAGVVAVGLLLDRNATALTRRRSKG